MGTSWRHRIGAALVAVGLSAGLAGCGDASTVDTAVPATSAPPSTVAAVTTSTTAPTPTTTTTTTAPAEPARTDLALDTVVGTIFDLDPGSGRWPAVAGATVAVRGSLAGPVEANVELLGHPFETWRLLVTEQVLGPAAGEEMLVAHPLETEPPWTDPEEAIYLLAPFIIAPGIVVPDLWVALGEDHVIRSDLDEHVELLRAGEALLGVGLAPILEPDAQQALADTRLVVEAAPGDEVDRGDVLGWGYVDVPLTDAEAVWSAVGPLPSGPPIVRLAAGDAQAWLDAGDRRPVPLTQSPFEDRWLVAGGRLDVTADVLAGADHREIGVLLDRAWGAVGERRNAADALLAELLRSAGRLPLPGEPFELVAEPPAPAPAPPPVVEVDYSQPFTIDQGGVRIVFDQWWWATLDPAARVQIVRDGQVVVEGPMSGDGAVAAVDAPTGDYIFFGPDGTPVASLSTAQLNAAIAARLAELAADG